MRDPPVNRNLFPNVKFDPEKEKRKERKFLRIDEIFDQLSLLSYIETTIWREKKGGGGEEEEKRGEWNGRRGGGEGRKRSWKGWTHWPGIKVPVPPSDALDHLGVDRGVGSRRP